MRKTAPAKKFVAYIDCGTTARSSTLHFDSKQDEIEFTREVMSLPNGPDKIAFVNMLARAKRSFDQPTP